VTASASANRRGMVALTFSMAAYATNDTFVKLVARGLPVGEVIFLRGVLSVLVLLGALWISGGFPSLRPAFQRDVMWRAFFDAAGTVCFIAALVRMNLAELSAVILTSPLILTALAAILLGNPVGWRRWCAIGVGLIGTLFIVKPSASSFDAWALVALAAAFFSAGRDLCTRRIDPSVPSLAVSVYGALAVTIAGAMIGTAESWAMPTGPQWLGITIAALFLGLGTYLAVIAFRGVDIPVVAPFRYTLLLWMGISGYVAFDETPDRWALVGTALIALSGLYALHREAVTRRQISASAVPPA
jgi:drug/metabolite transporter (DMT)-like permease